MPKINLDSIAFDAGTQIREAINEQVVGEYAERMSEGVAFPAVVLFADGCCRTDGSVIYYLADGFHRMQAAQRNGFVDIDADVRAGTKEDALWFALGANKANGHRMTAGDKRHAIVLAVSTFPSRSARQIAEQVGVNYDYVNDIRRQVSDTLHLPDRVTGKDGKSYPASRPARPSEPAAAPVQSRQVFDEVYVHQQHEVRAPSNGMQFARIAVMKLSEIRDDDTERAQAFNHVRAWLNEHESR